MDEDDYEKPQLPEVPDRCGPPTIPLSMLLDFAVQQVFHEITVLSELLPKKMDADRKISLVEFAQSTRLLFIKLLAMVKWVKTSRKFEQCASISYLLDQQAQYFVETADRLVMLAREELVLARLPSFQVVSAVDVLTQGTFSRLPLCIKQRFVKEAKITPREQANVLMRINQVLQYRISRIAHKLSPRIGEIVIKNGMVKLTVPGEFETMLTVLGETDGIKWTLLNIKILVEDYEIGYGTSLVHPLQLHMIHNVLQSRMDVSKNPLNEMYNFLHSFAQSLQLDVLFCQSTQLVTGRLRNKMVIEKYDSKERILSIGYWLHRVQTRKGQPARHTPQYRVQIYGDRDEPNTPLRVRHFPQGAGLGELNDKSGRLSIGRLLSETFSVRCKERLLRIRKRLEAGNSSACIMLSGAAAPTLSYPLVDGDDVTEQLRIAVNMFSGRVLCTVSALGSRQELKDLEKSLYDGLPVELLRKQIDRLKVILMLERYKRAVGCLQVRIISEAQMGPKLTKTTMLPRDRIILQFIKEENYYLIITFETDNSVRVKVDLYLLSAIDDRVTVMQLSKENAALAAPMARFMRMEADGTMVEDDPQNMASTSWERQLTCAVSAVDDRISFMRVCEELDRRGIKYKPVEPEPIIGGLYLQITDVSSALDIKAPEFFDNMVRCCLRLDTRARVLWPFECCLKDNPLPADYLPGKKNKGPRMRTWVQEVSGNTSSPNAASNSDCISNAIVERLSIYAHIYQLVFRFAKAYEKYYHKLCSIQAYTYHKLVIAYGPKRDQLLVLSFKPKNLAMNLNFGQVVPADLHSSTDVKWPEEVRWNPHAMMSMILNERLNNEMDLVELVHYVVSTSAPLCSLANFARIRFHSVKALAQMAQIEIQYPLQLKFHLFPVNEYTVRLVYGIVHLEFAMLEDNQVAIRDCARERPNCVGLHQFFNTLGAAKSFETGRGPSPSAPGSSHQITASPANPHLSVPSSSDLGGSPRPPVPPLQTSPALVLVDHATLHRACAFVENASGEHVSPLDQYLNAVVFVYRLGAALEVFHRSSSTTHSVRFDSLIVQPDSIRISLTSASPANPSKPHTPCQITFIIHIDPQLFNIKMSIEYNGDSAPADSDVRIMEAYFEKVVAKLGNEIALLSYINLCRITPNGALACIARIMQSQMDPSLTSLWTVAFQLCPMPRDVQQVPQPGQPAQNTRRFRPGVIIDGTQTLVKMLFCFRPQRGNIQEHLMEKHQFVINYNMATNMMALVTRIPTNLTEEEQNLSTVITQQNDISNRSGECPLWHAISRLMEKMSMNDIRGMPSSVAMPGSVVAPGSVGPIGSVGVSSQHNPLLNPGSNKM